MKKNFISILITNYNKEKYIQNCLSSVVNQNYKNYEILLYDDGSTDNSVLLIKNFKKIKLVRNKTNKKISPALNQIEGLIKLFKKSKGEIICLLDSDDIFNLDKLSNINSYFEKNKKKNFLVNLLKGKKKFIIKRDEPNNSIWPTIFPTSCISCKKKFFNNFLKLIKRKEFPNLEIDARLVIFAYHYYLDFNILNLKLTNYVIDINGITSKYQKFSFNWWLKRNEAFQYLKYLLLKKKKVFINSLDYFITINICNILKNYLKIKFIINSLYFKNRS